MKASAPVRNSTEPRMNGNPGQRVREGGLSDAFSENGIQLQIDAGTWFARQNGQKLHAITKHAQHYENFKSTDKFRRFSARGKAARGDTLAINEATANHDAANKDKCSRKEPEESLHGCSRHAERGDGEEN